MISPGMPGGMGSEQFDRRIIYIHHSRTQKLRSFALRRALVFFLQANQGLGHEDVY